MATSNHDRTTMHALEAARMYYHLDLTSEQIARRLGVSRSQVSRLLTWAKSNGIVEFKVIDRTDLQLELETELEERFEIPEVKVVSAAPYATDEERTDAVTRFAAHYLNSLATSNTTIALAWGNTVGTVASRLIPKPLPGVQVVQLNGSGNSGTGTTYAADIVMRFAHNYNGSPALLPIPAYFDDPATKEAMFKERSIRRVVDLAAKANMLLYSIGVPNADSYIYRAGYIERSELDELLADGVVGDIATVFFRADGSYQDVAMNARSSGPELSSLSRHQHTICIVAGHRKREAILGALHGHFMTTLVIDEPTARSLLA